VWGCGGGAIAAGLIAIGLSVGSTVEGGKLDANAAGLVSMPYSQAQPTASRANGMLGAGVGLGVAAIALATAAIVLHLSSPEPSPP
jgi:hypothetical protein